jgi:hypothetical protein
VNDPWLTSWLQIITTFAAELRSNFWNEFFLPVATLSANIIDWNVKAQT